MSDSSLQDCDDCIAPTEAFGLVSNETRLRILEELWKAPERPVSFSELRRRVEMRDSAQFNYHLGKLTGQFVAKTDEGYDLQYAGKKVVRAVLSGTFNQRPRLAAFDVGSDCVECGEPLMASYADEQLAIECPDCGRLHGRYPFPPGGLNDRSKGEILDAFDQRIRHLHCLAADGVCPECSGKVETNLAKADGDLTVRVDHRCQQCGHTVHSTVGLTLLDQSDVVAFHHDHGIDLCGTPYWEFEWCVSDAYTTVESVDPWRVEVAVPVEEDRIVLTLDGDLTVRDVEEERASPA